MPQKLHHFLNCMLLCAAIAGSPWYVQAGSPRNADPFVFIENRGQIQHVDGGVCHDALYTAAGNGATVFLRSDGVSYVLQEVTTGAHRMDGMRSRRSADHADVEDIEQTLAMYRVDMRLIGSNELVRIRAENASPTVYNYYYTHCPEGITGVQGYRRIVYENVYPNIDLALYSNTSGMKYDFIVRPGGDPGDIRLEYTGAAGARLNEQGSIIFSTPLGEITEGAPLTFQDELRNVIPSSYELHKREDAFAVGFRIGDFDRSRTLTIDPSVLWSTFHGGGANDDATDITVDNAGNILVAGRTTSTDFPVQGNVVQTSGGGQFLDGFISKIDNNGQTIWATYFGGDQLDVATAIVTDHINNIIVTGHTRSDSIPMSGLTFIDTLDGNSDAFVAKFTRNGVLLWSTYFGGNDGDQATDIAVDAEGHVAVVGWTNVEGSDFPLFNAIKEANNGFRDVFIARFSAGTGFPLFATLYGGTDDDDANAVAIDGDGNIIVAGKTRSDDFPTTQGALEDEFQGDRDIFIMKFTPLGDTVWATYFGGSAADEALSLDVNAQNEIVLGGWTISDTDFPLLNPTFPDFASDFNFAADGIIVKFDADGTLLWSTYYGGHCFDEVHSVAFEPSGAIAATGLTASFTLPVTEDNLQDTLKHDRTAPGFNNACEPPPPMDDDPFPLEDAFILRLTAEGDTLFSTYYGGDSIDIAEGIAVDADENIYMTGLTWSPNFPTNNAEQDDLLGNTDAFILRYGCDIAVAISHETPTEFCRGGLVELDAGAGFEQYEWSNGAETQRIMVDDTEEFTVTVTDQFGCSITSEPIAVVVHDLPQPEIENDGAAVLCDGESTTLTVNGEFASFRWSNNAETPSITVDAAGEYTVIVTDENGCEGSSTATIEARVTPQPLFSEETELDFGDLEDCDPFVERVITITNTDDGPIVLAQPTVSGTGFGVVDPEFPATIEPGRQLVVTVEFRPTAAGNFTADILFGGTPCGFSRSIDLKGSKQSISLTSDQTDIAFGNIFVCDPEAQEAVIVLRNTSGAPATITGVDIEDPFEVIEPTFPQDLDDGQELNVRITFTPSAEGDFADNAIFRYSTGACDAELSIPISGAAIDTELITDNTAIDFGLLSGCETTADATITITNGGDVDIEIISVDVTDPFGVTDDAPDQIAQNSSADFTFEFTPAGDGVVNDQAIIRYRVGPCEKTLTIDLTGDRRGLAIAADESLDIGEIILCAQTGADGVLTIRNQSSGAVSGRIKEVILTGPITTNISIGDELDQGAIREYAVTVEPDSEGDIVGSVEVIFEPCDISVTIDISGTATDVAFASPADVVIGPLAAGTSGSESFVFTNTGSAAITVTRIEGIEEPFRVAEPELPATVEAGAELTVVIEYAAAEGESTITVRPVGGIPCAFEGAVEFSVIGEDRNPQVRLAAAIPTLEARTTDRDYPIPITLVVGEGLAAAPLDSFRVEIRFNATLFYPQRASVGAIVENELTGSDERRVVIAGAWPADVVENTSITDLIGYVKIGNAASMVIDLTEFEVTGAADIETQSSSGSLHIVNICEAGGQRFLQQSSFGITQLSPNPSEGTVAVTGRAPAAETTQLAIYTLGGECVFKETWIPAGNSGSVEFTVQIEHRLAPGMYSITLRNALRSEGKRLVVVR